MPFFIYNFRSIMRFNIFITLVLWTLVLLTGGCRTVGPLNDARPDTVAQKEIEALVQKAWTDFKESTIATRDSLTEARVRNVFTRVNRAVTTSEAGWDVHVYDKGPASAFILPGQRLAVQAGFVNRLQTDAELAAVFAHLLAHQAAVHGTERLGKLLPANRGSDQRELSQLVMLAYRGFASNRASTWCTFKLQHETVADSLAVIYLSRAGFKPAAILTAWERLNREYENAPLFLQIHPMSTKRRGKLKQALEETAAWY
ncbi:MAG: M48 family metalloprotease [Lentisphaeria bacterium]